MLLTIVVSALATLLVLQLVRSPAATADATAAAACSPAPASELAGWSDEQITNARTIVRIGRERRVPARGQVIALATSLQESRLRNLRGGDRDSIGLFQQRPSQGWGTPKQLSDPAYQTGKFYDKLLKIKGWERMRLTEAAQAVQISAFPEAYTKHTDSATKLAQSLC